MCDFKIFPVAANFREGRVGQHQVRCLREAGLAQQLLLLRDLQGVNGREGIHTGKGKEDSIWNINFAKLFFRN